MNTKSRIFWPVVSILSLHVITMTLLLLWPRKAPEPEVEKPQHVHTPVVVYVSTNLVRVWQSSTGLVLTSLSSQEPFNWVLTNRSDVTNILASCREGDIADFVLQELLITATNADGEVVFKPSTVLHATFVPLKWPW